MRSTWTLAVEQLGRIDRADVEVRPLTLLIGENNTGKSYFATLLWGLVAAGWELRSPEGAELAACQAWAKTNLLSTEPTFDRSLNEVEAAMFQRLFDAAVTAGKDAFTERLFRSKKVPIRSVQFHNLLKPSEIRWTWEHGASHGYGLRRSPPWDKSPAVHWGIVRDYAAKMAVDQIRNDRVLAEFAQPGFKERATEGFDPGDPIFIPASRTGYMHLYREVLRARLTRAPQEGAAGDSSLTMPAAHFLDFVAFGPHSARGPYEDACALLETAMSGHIELSIGRGANEVHYAMNGVAERLSMPLSSALVSELAPLLLVLRGASPLRLLVLEEPESHLHPRLVRLVAQVIARLVRKGVQVVVTTHSADFCQQINNFIKLGSLPPDLRARLQTEYGYAEQDYLDEGEVAGYQFRAVEQGRSTVTRLEGSPSGLAMPTFNEELVSLSRQTLALQRAVESDG